MRGANDGQSSMLMLMSPEALVPPKHPARSLKKLADECLASLSGVFDQMYSSTGRPSIPPERLLKSMLLMALYSINSERMFCERLRYDLLFRWFLDMSMVDEPFDASSLSRNRERLLEHEVAHRFLQEVVRVGRKNRLMSNEHFSVDGTLIEAWASMKSFKPRGEKDEDHRGDGNGWGDFKGMPRSNETHESMTDPEAKLIRKGRGQAAKLSFGGHVLMENRNGLIVDATVKPAVGCTEPEAALELLMRSGPPGGATVGADRGYDTKAFIAGLRDLGHTPHVAQHINSHRGSAIDARTTRHAGYRISSVVRRRIESIFGWAKTVGGCRKSRYRGVARTELFTLFAAAAYNLLRISRLLRTTA